MPQNQQISPWPVFASEFIGTALLVGLGLSVVIFDLGKGSVMLRLLPGIAERRALTGFLFGTIGALIALSPVGRISGAHINPAVSIAFWLSGKLRARHTAGYVLAQLAGAVIGSVPLLAWGATGRSVDFGATAPGFGYGAGAAAAGEVVTTFCLVAGLFVFIGTRALREFTPALLPPLYAIMVWLEAPISGTSTNPARSLGPAVIAGNWHGWWVYWLGPLIGASVPAVIYRFAGTGWLRIEVAKLKHFEADAYAVFHALDAAAAPKQ